MSDQIADSIARIQASVKTRPPEELERRAAEQEAQRKAARIAELRQAWNAPARHVKKHTDKAIITGGRWSATLETIAGRIGEGFLIGLHGCNGPGKTQMAVELMFQTTAQSKSALFCTATQFFIEVKTTYKHESAESEADVVKRYQKPSLLVIDEVDKRGATEWESNLLFYLLNRRYNDMKDTLLIANMNASELEGSLGKSLVSRLNETGGMIDCSEMKSFR